MISAIVTEPPRCSVGDRDRPLEGDNGRPCAKSRLRRWIWLLDEGRATDPALLRDPLEATGGDKDWLLRKPLEIGKATEPNLVSSGLGDELPDAGVLVRAAGLGNTMCELLRWGASAFELAEAAVGLTGAAQPCIAAASRGVPAAPCSFSLAL